MRTLPFALALAVLGCAGARPDTTTDYANVRGDRGYCPLCSMWHPRSEMLWPYEWNGRSYVFCDPNCRATFARDPERYLKDEQFQHASLGYRTVTLDVEGFSCDGCARGVASALRNHAGVKRVRASFAGKGPSGSIEITFDPDLTDETHLIEEISTMSDGVYKASRRIDVRK